MTNDDLKDLVDHLHPEIINMLRDLSDEGLQTLRKLSTEKWKDSKLEVSNNKVRRVQDALTELSNGTRERERASGMRNFVMEFDKLATLTDKEFAERMRDELWAYQSWCSRESAMLEVAGDRLSRSSAGPLEPITQEALELLLESVK